MIKKLFVIGLVLGTLVGCGRIETGHVGVRTDFNKTVEGTVLNPGWYGALFTSVDEFSIKEIEVAQNDMKPKAKDNLSLQDLDVTVFYKVNPAMVSDMLIKYTLQFEPASGQYRMTYRDRDDAVVTIKAEQLPPEVRIDSTHPGYTLTGDKTSFNSRGGADNGTIVLSDSSGKSKKISISIIGKIEVKN